jgi:hypothetical protein
VDLSRPTVVLLSSGRLKAIQVNKLSISTLDPDVTALRGLDYTIRS